MDERKLIERCVEVIERVREERPLVHHLTNMVVANDNANTMLAVGALPVMAWAEEEVEEMVASAQALVVNLGTLTTSFLQSALLAGKRANALKIPVVLDVPGAGATYFRSESAHRFLSTVKVSVLRGNAGEIRSLIGGEGKVRGVEAVSEEDTASLSQEAASLWGVTTAVTGRIDGVSDGRRTVRVHNGHLLLTRITGSGCMATSLCGACLAVEKEALYAATAALGFLGVCAEQAFPKASGPGSFLVALFDTLFALRSEEFRENLRLEVCYA